MPISYPSHWHEPFFAKGDKYDKIKEIIDSINSLKILQVISVCRCSATSTTSTSFTDLADMSISVTMTSSSNKLLIMFTGTTNHTDSTTKFIDFAIQVGSTYVCTHSGTCGSGTGCTSSSLDICYRHENNIAYSRSVAGFNVLYAPGSGTHTVKIRWKTNATLAECPRDAGIRSLTVMEVVA